MRVSRRRSASAAAAAAETSREGGLPEIEGYTELAVIGHGGSATVYRARQSGYGRTVALKVINVDASNRKAQRRFTSERELNGRLSDHPNVVTVLDSGFVDGRFPYLAMEFFEYGSLTDRLTERGPLDVDVALHVGVRIAGALESAHRLGVLHRDVKPQNILMSRYGEPALADFGIATMLELEQSFTHALTPVHAAPEILEGADPTTAADIYSLGSTLYTLLAGAPPFAGPAGEGMLAQLLRITTSDLPALARSDVPPSLTQALLDATAKRPEARVSSAAELGHRLQAVQSELDLAVTPLPIEGTGLRSSATTTWAAPVAPEPAPAPAPVAAPIPVVSVQPDSGDNDVTIGQQPDSPTVAARQLHDARRPSTPPKRRRGVIAGVAGGVLAIALIGGLLRTVGPWGDDDAAPSTTATPTDTAAPTATSTPAPDPGAGGTDGAPTGVTAEYFATSDGWLISWSDAADDAGQPVVFIHRADQPPLTEVPAPGSNSHVVEADVASDEPVCFVVANVIIAADDEPITVESEPVCRNGAVAAVPAVTTDAP